MLYEKKIIFGMTAISAFVLFVGLCSFYVQIQIDTGNVCGCIIPISLFIPFLASIGLFIGSMIYYFLRPVSGPLKIKREAFLCVFGQDEKKIIGFLLDNSGEGTQSGMAGSTGMSKVKVFRVLERLAKKGVIRKDPYGKTNRIVLRDELKNSIE